MQKKQKKKKKIYKLEMNECFDGMFSFMLYGMVDEIKGH